MIRSAQRARAGAFALLGAALLLPSCHDSGTSPARLRAQLDEARARWDDAGLVSYAVTERHLCFCPAPFEWTVVVADGTPSFVDAVVDPGDGGQSEYLLESLAMDQSMSVEQMFDWISQRIGRVATLDVSFDEQLGYPTRVAVDVDKGAVDDEITWLLSDVTPTGACTEIGCQDQLRVSVRAPAGGFAAGDYKVTAVPLGGSASSCTFTLTLGGPCPYSICVQGGSSCGAALIASDEILVPLPFSSGSVQVTVDIDGKTAVVATLDPDLARSQPNGSLCPPVCWSADVDVSLP